MQTNVETVGWSPKVWIPAAGQIVGGIVLLLIGMDVEGRSLIGSGFATLFLGRLASPGKVVPKAPAVVTPPQP